MDRPSRKTKVVNYCEAKDFDDDEDFACVKAPPSKKAREDVKREHKKSSSKSSSQESNSESNSESSVSQKSRRPLDERLHDRDLEAAITLSLLNNPDLSPTSKGDGKVQALLVDENTDPVSLHRSNCSVDIEILGLDEITTDKESLSRQRKAAAKATEESRKKPTHEDEDYEPKMTPDSESDDNFSEPSESEDEEFAVKKVSKTKKKEKATKTEKTKQPPVPKKEKPASKPASKPTASKSKSQTAAVTTPVRSPPTAKSVPKRPAPSSSVSTSKPSFSPSSAAGRIPKWNPPGQIGKSPTSAQSPAVRSPSQGLRLGLSRLVRVKPLHPSVASH